MIGIHVLGNYPPIPPHLGQNAGLGEGWVGSLSETLIIDLKCALTLVIHLFLFQNLILLRMRFLQTLMIKVLGSTIDGFWEEVGIKAENYYVTLKKGNFKFV